MKFIFELIWAVLMAISVFGALFYVSLWLVWGRFISVDTGVAFAMMAAAIFFVLRIQKLLKKRKEIKISDDIKVSK